MSPLLPTAALLALVCLWLLHRLRVLSRARRAARAGYFDLVRPLFAEGEVRLEPTGFARMTGRRDGLGFDFRAVPDALAFRKLPVLWVMVTLIRPLPIGATVSVMARPSGLEPFSSFAALPQSLPTPPELPGEVALRTDDARRAPPASLIAAHADLFADPRVKELVLSPRGLRIVILAEEADRNRFLIFREAEVGMTPLAPARIAPVLDRLAALSRDLARLAERPA